MPEVNERHAVDHLVEPRVAELTERIGWFIMLRWLAVVGILVAVPIGKHLLGFEHLAVNKIRALAACLFLLNCAYLIASRTLRKRAKNGGGLDPAAATIFASVQIVLDLLILSAILYFACGIRNPFGFYYVFHVVIASILLGRGKAYAVAGLCVAFYSAIALVQYFHPSPDHVDGYTLGYAITMVLAVGSTLLIAAFMATSIMGKLRQKEGELERALREVSKLEETKSRFLRLVSHEMKSPIVAIQSILDAVSLTARDQLDPKGAQMLARASERAESLLALTKDLLTHSRQQTPDADFESAENVDMLDLTRKGVQFYKAQADKRQIRLVEEYPEGPFHVKGDPDSLDLVIGNLVSNAIRYTPSGGEVCVVWRIDPPWGVLKVSDTGIGIPESEMPNIFHEFFRAQNAKVFTASGTGLGLAITRNVVEKTGGSISVQSKENQGTTFTVMLPVTAG